MPPAEALRAAAAPSRARVVIILGALSAFGPLSIDMYLPALPRLGRDFGVGASQAQLTLSACLMGLAFGQLLAGPISDAVGRRRPLLIGVAAYALASLACVFAPSLAALVGLRFVQGAAGAAGIVIARAVVRDLHSGVAAAKFFSLLMLVNGLAPILAPIAGGQLLRFTSWRGVFVALAVIGVLIAVGTAGMLPETLPPERRQDGGVGATLRTFGRLLADRSFVGYALCGGLGFAAMFAYISGSPFVLQTVFGLSPQAFSLVFGLNALGLVAASQVNGRLVGRISPHRLLGAGLLVSCLGGFLLLAVILSDTLGLAGVLPALFLVMASRGFANPNAMALALSGHPRTAGSASALQGMLQFAFGAAAAPLTGVGGSATALPMAVVIAVLGLCAMLAFLFLTVPGLGDEEPAG